MRLGASGPTSRRRQDGEAGRRLHGLGDIAALLGMIGARWRDVEDELRRRRLGQRLDRFPKFFEPPLQVLEGEAERLARREAPVRLEPEEAP